MKAGVILLSLVMFSTTAHADTTHVYECTINGERVFSDHVCGDGAVERNVTVTSRMDSVKLSASPKPDRQHHVVPTTVMRGDYVARRFKNPEMRLPTACVQDSAHVRMKSSTTGYGNWTTNTMSYGVAQLRSD